MRCVPRLRTNCTTQMCLVSGCPVHTPGRFSGMPSDHKIFYDREDFVHAKHIQDSLEILGNDVAKFDSWVLNLKNLLEFWDFLNILGIQLLQVSLC